MAGPYQFPRSSRLTRRAQYTSVFKDGRRITGRHFICYVTRPNEPGSKLGLAVSRKVGKAVVRNRVKRYLREFYRTHRPSFSADIHLVVVARPESRMLSYEECAQVMTRLLRQGGVLDG